MLVHAANDLAFGEAIANRLAELAALSDEPGRLTRLYLGPAHRPRRRPGRLLDARRRDVDPHRSAGQRRRPLRSARRRNADADARLPHRQRPQCRPVRRAAWGGHGDRSGEGGVQIRHAVSVRHRGDRLRRRRGRALCLDARRIAGAGRHVRRKGARRARRKRHFPARGAGAISAAIRRAWLPRNVRRTGRSATSKCTSNKARCWKRKACRWAL